MKRVHRWCPAVSISFSILMLLCSKAMPALRERLYWGKSLWNEVGLGTSVYVSSSGQNWIFQCNATGWQAGFLWDWPSPHSCYVFHVCVTKSEHPCLYYLLHYFCSFFSFAFFKTNISEKEETTLRPSPGLKLIRHIKKSM